MAAAIQDVATRSHELGRAEDRVVALDQGLAAHGPVEERLALVEAALHAQVERAVSAPAPYVRGILGPEPVDAGPRTGWRAAARAIEVYRHENLGLGPDAGPLAQEGPEQALGLRPQDHVAAQRWDATAALVANPGGPDLEPAALIHDPPALEL